MFSAKRRLIATICIVGFLVASLGMYTEPAHASGPCSALEAACDILSGLADSICADYGNSSHECLTARAIAWAACFLHYNICGGG